jgi:hypothetical protein
MHTVRTAAEDVEQAPLGIYAGLRFHVQLSAFMASSWYIRFGHSWQKADRGAWKLIPVDLA